MPKSFGLPERYRVLSELGSGGMGSVYKARDSSLDKVVAIKLLKSEVIGQDPKAVQRFQREAQATGKLKNDFLVTTLDFGVTAEGLCYLVLEYIEGKTLKELIAENGRLSVEFALELFIQMISGMVHAHAQKVIHRDLKSANIIVFELEDGSKQIKIIDFGIAKVQDENLSLTDTNAIVGSPLYMSP